MAKVSTYLNFMGTTEEAFSFYKDAFGGTYLGEIARMGDVPSPGGELPEDERDKIMHIELEILGGHVLMGTDMLRSMGHELKVGNNVTINLELDGREEAERLYGVLSEGGSDQTGLMDMPWGLWGCTLDRYGIRWMFNVASAA